MEKPDHKVTVAMYDSLTIKGMGLLLDDIEAVLDKHQIPYEIYVGTIRTPERSNLEEESDQESH